MPPTKTAASAQLVRKQMNNAQWMSFMYQMVCEIHHAPYHSQEDLQQREEISHLKQLEEIKRRVQNHSAC